MWRIEGVSVIKNVGSEEVEVFGRDSWGMNERVRRARAWGESGRGRKASEDLDRRMIAGSLPETRPRAAF